MRPSMGNKKLSELIVRFVLKQFCCKINKLNNKTLVSLIVLTDPHPRCEQKVNLVHFKNDKKQDWY